MANAVAPTDAAPPSPPPSSPETIPNSQGTPTSGEGNLEPLNLLSIFNEAAVMSDDDYFAVLEARLPEWEDKIYEIMREMECYDSSVPTEVSLVREIGASPSIRKVEDGIRVQVPDYLLFYPDEMKESLLREKLFHRIEQNGLNEVLYEFFSEPMAAEAGNRFALYHEVAHLARGDLEKKRPKVPVVLKAREKNADRHAARAALAHDHKDVVEGGIFFFWCLKKVGLTSCKHHPTHENRMNYLQRMLRSHCVSNPGESSQSALP